jgi:glycosyltransferase involved in cell wall biosynthesis
VRGQRRIAAGNSTLAGGVSDKLAGVWQGSKVVVVVPAWQEAPRIGRVIRGMPAWVDSVIVVDDDSTDGTAEAAGACHDPRVQVVSHARNRGVGAAIMTGYARALGSSGGASDAFAVMAGDDQMDPRDLPGIVAPITRGEADYVKGNRFGSGGIVRTMPVGRLVGGLVFSWATARAIGVPVSDSQCGYTAISRSACARLDLDAIWPRYGYPNDLLSHVARLGLRIGEAPVRAVYADEVSRLRPRHAAVVAGLIARAWLLRLSDPRPGSAMHAPGSPGCAPERDLDRTGS